MAKKKKDQIWYAYCHKCKKLLAKCCDNEVAIAVETFHRNKDRSCSVTTGIKEYFDKVNPDVDLQDHVLLVIEGGCANLIEKPKGIELQIKDYDVEGVDAEDDDRCMQDSDGDWYQSMFWGADENV